MIGPEQWTRYHKEGQTTGLNMHRTHIVQLVYTQIVHLKRQSQIPSKINAKIQQQSQLPSYSFTEVNRHIYHEKFISRFMYRPSKV